MRIVFMGTPDFAKTSLMKLIEQKYDVVAVYTQPDRPSGRGKKLLPPPVKTLAEEKEIPVFQPKSMRKPEEIAKLKALNPDICVVVAYGQILPKSVLDIPKYGCINLHGSLLPKYRGAAPIQWSIINGEKITGVTSMFISKGLDEGDIILQDSMKIGENTTSEDLFLSMADVGSELLVKTLEQIKNNTAKRTPQSDTGIEATFAPMLSKKHGELDFSKTAKEIHNLVRGLVPWPIATFNIILGDRKEKVKVFSTSIIEEVGEVGEYAEGEVLPKKDFIVGCGENTFIKFNEVQLAGKKRVTGRDFLNGNHVKAGDVLK